jgi:ribosomal peptide maturation radical SAM protein 1
MSPGADRRNGDDRVDVLLVGMPFGLVVTPSLAVGLLHASVAHLPYRTRQWHPCLDFAKLVGFDTYWTAANRWEIGDWAFAAALFPEHDLHAQGFIDNILRRPSADNKVMLASVPGKENWIENSVEAAWKVRNTADAFLEECLRAVRAMRPRMVGFSCLFQQLVPSLALARRVKAALPETFIMFGGNECYGVKAVEVARQFPFVDAVVSGAGDVVFPEIVERVLQRRGLEGLEGVYWDRSRLPAGAGDVVNAAPPSHMNDLPYPMFDGFFEDLERLGVEIPMEIYLSLETSRGCWWGQHPKRHCTFCSLNGAVLTYSSKSSKRMVEEIEFFARKYPGKPLIMTDSIVEMDYFRDALPELANRQLGATIQYETRAALTKPQLRMLHDAGVTLVQPGIESLSTPVLRIMRKFTTSLINVQFLKWSREFGLEVMWNLLGGFPGEPAEAYHEMEKLIPLITHLPPPSRFRLVELNRWAPMFEQAEALGVTGLKPAPFYPYVYPFPPEAIAHLAAYFEYEYVVPQPVEEYSVGVQEQVRLWKAAYEAGTSALYATDDGERTVISDRRPVAKCKGYILEGFTRFIYRACDQIRSLNQLQRLAEAEGYPPISEDELLEVLSALEERLLMIREDDRYLSLAVQVAGHRNEKKVAMDGLTGAPASRTEPAAALA